MSWQNCYHLPWTTLDCDQIAAAVEHVFRSGAGLDLARCEIEPVPSDIEPAPPYVVVYFYFPAKLERRWSLYRPDVDRNFQLYKIAEDDEAFVQIDFREADAELELPAYFEFYSNISGNFVFSGVGIEVAERLGRYFGVKCEPL